MANKKSNLENLLTICFGHHEYARVMRLMHVPETVLVQPNDASGDTNISRAEIAFALNMLLFRDLVERVPGSFYEFISRDSVNGKLDLGFDSGNATAIFKMTSTDATNLLKQ